MNLIDKYVTEVGKHLPRSQRADIEKEIRSTLEDMLEERGQASLKDEAAVIALLKEYGEPRKVAESYIGPRYLIGPRLYPTFELVLKIVMAVLFALALAGLAFSLSRSSLTGPELLNTLGRSALDLFSGLIAALGNIVLVFAILERVLPAKELEKEAAEWNPADLAKEPDPDRVSFGEQVAGIFFLTLFLIVFNVYPNIIGIGFFDNNRWVFISPILSEAFFSYLPWINILILLQIGFSVYLLRQGMWNTGLRIVNILLEVAGIALAVVMLRGPELVALKAEQLAGTPLEGSAQLFTTLGNVIPMLVLTIVIIVSTVEVGQMVYRLLSARPLSR
ncbi:MAG: HAAS signaling domain-containing protein [Chloroflexota bacterium]